MTMTKTAAIAAARKAVTVERMGRGWEIHSRTPNGIYVSPSQTYSVAQAMCAEKRVITALISMGHNTDDALYLAHVCDNGSFEDRMRTALARQ